MAKRKELRKEDVRTYRQQLEFSRQVWQREQEMLASWDPAIFDFVVETEPWESAHFWLNEAQRQRAERKMLKELGLDKYKR